MEKKKKNRPPLYNKGYRNEIVKSLLTTGLLTRNTMKIMEGEYRMYLRVSQKLCKERIAVQIKNVVKGIAINEFDAHYEEYISCYPTGTYKYYKEYGEYNRQKVISSSTEKKEISKIVKAAKDSEVYNLMGMSEIRTYPEDKYEVEELKKVEKAIYYTGREIKSAIGYEAGVMKDKTLLNTRMNGLLITSQEIYPIYHIDKGIIKWRNVGEEVIKRKIGLYLTNQLEEYRNGVSMVQIDKCILIGINDAPFHQLVENKGTQEYMHLDKTYAKYYALPYCRESIKMLNIMCRPDWENEMLELLIPERDRMEMGKVESRYVDGQNDDYASLLFCIPDLKKLRQFKVLAQAENDSTKFMVYCFTHQAEYVKKEIGEYARISHLPIEKYINRLEHKKEMN